MAVPEQSEPGPDRRDAATLVDHREAQPLASERSVLPDPGKEAPVGLEAAERDVLAVVRRRRRVAFALGQRLDGAAEGGPRLVKDDLVSCVDQPERRREACEPSSHNRDPQGKKLAPTIRSFVSRESRGGPSKTANPLASIRSSVAR